jgi:serine/threonine protein kinase
MSYDYGIDTWALGCTLYEIFTGRFLFEGIDNNDMLFQQIRVLGPPPKKFLKKGLFAAEHFDLESGSFKRLKKDKVSGREYAQVIPNSAWENNNVSSSMLVGNGEKKRDLKNEILSGNTSYSSEEKQALQSFYDLLAKIFVWDPKQRISVEQALQHPFFASFITNKKTPVTSVGKQANHQKVNVNNNHNKSMGSVVQSSALFAVPRAVSPPLQNKPVNNSSPSSWSSQLSVNNNNNNNNTSSGSSQNSFGFTKILIPSIVKKN